MNSTPVYNLRVSEVYTALETSIDGLSGGDVKARQDLYGTNILTEQRRESFWMHFIVHSIHPMALLLWVASILAFVVQQPALGVVIWLVVLVNAASSLWREYRAEQAIVVLSKLLPAYARVIRNGEEILVPASEVVPGDVLVLAEGDNIPADARVVEDYGLRTNNSTLTGEAVPARKTADASLQEGFSEVERSNLVFAGTSVVSGTGRAVVYATGMLTQFGRIAHLTQAVKEEPSPLQKELTHVTRTISFVAIGLGAIVLFVGISDRPAGITPLEVYLLALGVIVGVIPEGLPATISLSLAMAVQRLTLQQVLVKKPAVIETLGTVSIICTDKSGTLTQNQMTVREIWVGRRSLSVSGVGYEPKGEFSPTPAGEPFENDLSMLLMAGMLCNNSRLNPPSPENHHWTSLGDQTEVALRVAAIKGGLEEHNTNLLFPRVHELPFDARRKRMSTIHRDSRGDIAFVKGAPREVLQLCTSIIIYGEVRPLTNEIRADILAANDDYARKALRVLALARRDLPPRAGAYTPEKVERDLTFLGLMAMMDPPRPEVAEAMKSLRQAGIRVVMITGDYGLTAESLARRVGMLSSANPRILTGADVDALNDSELQGLLNEEIIFARMAPEHKLRLVSAYQARGEVVAVTGDGVNDAPALRKADVGVAMGLIGTDVAKEAADVIITNDNFATIVTAISEGRAVFDNLRKFITYIFSSNVPEILPFIMTAMFNIPLAITIRQILAIDLGTDILPAIALSQEKPEPDVMRRPPRKRSQPFFDRGLYTRAFLWLGAIEGILCFAGFTIIYLLYGHDPFLSTHFGFLRDFILGLSFIPKNLGAGLDLVPITAITVYHAGVVMAQVGNAFASRTEINRGRHLGWFSNPLLWAGTGIEILIILALIYIRPLAVLFQHHPFPPIFWVFLGLYAPAVYALDWIRKSLVRRYWNPARPEE